jgi:GGDEF domain-containing protein
MEGSKRREEPHRVLQHTLDLLWERTKKKDDQPVDIDALRARIMAGGTLRENNTDLTESQWEELLSGLTSDEHRELVEGMRLTNLTLRKKLDEHPKFRDMQNANAFKRDFDASKSPGAFVFFDLINFKNLNSRYSYSFVDEVVLQNLCSALKAGLPAGSLIAIKGGDEFMIKIPAIAAGAETERVLELLGRNNQRSPSDAWILSPRDASALVAAIVKRSMESLPTSTIAHGQRHLVHKQKGIVGTATDLLSTYVLRRNPNDPALQAAKTASIQSDVSRVHEKTAKNGISISRVRQLRDQVERAIWRREILDYIKTLY